MAKKKEKADKPAAQAETSVPAEAEEVVQADDAGDSVTAEAAETVQDSALLKEEETAYEEEETALSPETLEEIGSPDREEVFQKVARAIRKRSASVRDTRRSDRCSCSFPASSF